jgi:hypothetical protein
MATNDEQRSRRYRAYQGADAMKKVIEELDGLDEVKRRELENLVTVTLRLILAESDGNVSEQKLISW